MRCYRARRRRKAAYFMRRACSTSAPRGPVLVCLHEETACRAREMLFAVLTTVLSQCASKVPRRHESRQQLLMLLRAGVVRPVSPAGVLCAAPRIQDVEAG